MTQVTSSPSETPLLERLSSKLLPELKVYIERHRGQVETMIEVADGDSGLAASRRYSRVIDGLLSAVFLAAKTASTQHGGWCPIALSAVGSYGRNTLSLFSDLDVRILVDGELDDAQQAAEALLYPLWDAGLSVGHQVVSAEQVIELARTDLPTATSLLDWRYLSGERELTDSFQKRVFDEVFDAEGVRAFLDLLSDAGVRRKERFGGSVFLLEPDLKNGAGGLRDVDLAHWAARARWRVGSLAELVQIGVLLPDEWEELSSARNFLMRIRNALHHKLRRQVDRLGFAEQELIGERLGYGTGGAAVESFMSDYYRHARDIERTTEMILRRARPPSSKPPSEVSIGRGMVLAGEKLKLADPDMLHTEPVLALAIYQEAMRRGLRVADGSRRSIMRAASIDSFGEHLRGNDEAAQIFKALVCTADLSPFKYGSVLTELHEVGLLLAMIPEFAPVVGRVHYDVYHVYTVDVHSIAAVDLLRSIFRGEHSEKTATDVAASVEQVEAVFFATLLHDIGKDIGGRAHAERGAVLAVDILARFGFEQDDVEAVQHLIREHLSMYLVATRRDIDDPRTLENFASKIKGRAGLRQLFLLTLADVGSTSPGTLNPWKLRMLGELYWATYRWMGGGSKTASNEQSITAARAAIGDAVPAAFMDEFLGALPARYFSANTPDRIAEHAALACSSNGEKAVLRVLRVDGAHAEVAIFAADQPGLLARISAVLCQNNLKVVAAQIFSWAQAGGGKRALDIFWVQSGQDASDLTHSVDRLNAELLKMLGGSADVRAVTRTPGSGRWSQRPAPDVPVQVRIDNEGATAHTILEVISKDRPDLLFWLAETIHLAGYTIELAKIHTEGARVTDVFYICTAAGEKLTDDEQIQTLRTALVDAISHLASTYE